MAWSIGLPAAYHRCNLHNLQEMENWLVQYNSIVTETLEPFVTVNAVLLKWKYQEENLNEILMPKAIRECWVRFLSDLDTDIDLVTSRWFPWNMQQINWNVKTLNGLLLLLMPRFHARDVGSAIYLCTAAAAACRCLFVELINLNFSHSLKVVQIYLFYKFNLVRLNSRLQSIFTTYGGMRHTDHQYW